MENKISVKQKIINIQTKIISIKANGNNSRFGKYLQEGDILLALKSLLKEENLGYAIDLVGDPIFIDKGNMVRFYSKGYLRIFDEGEDEFKVGIDVGADNTDTAKAIGSALTYAERYNLSKIFGIPTDELDPDNDKNDPVQINKKKVTKEEPKIDLMNPEYLFDKQIDDFISTMKTNDEVKQAVMPTLKEEAGIEGLTLTPKNIKIIIKERGHEFLTQLETLGGLFNGN